jgi:O-acetyl-ADP-ribose deacetylase
MEMRALSNGDTMMVVKGDLTSSRHDAIVNASNEHLLSGGGLSGAIHSAAGPGLESECKAIIARRGPLHAGDAVITGGHRLPAGHVIHAVGPVWRDGDSNEEATLYKTYRSAIRAADGHGLTSIAFPSISTGIYGYPVELAAPVAVRAVTEGLIAAKSTREATFVLFDDTTYEAYAAALRGHQETPAR